MLMRIMNIERLMTIMQTITLSEVIGDVRHALTGTIMSSGDDVDRFNDGVVVGNNAERVTIAINNVWGARNKDNSNTPSYEKIGYHSGSVDFITGVLKSGCPVIAYRADGAHVSKFRVTAN